MSGHGFLLSLRCFFVILPKCVNIIFTIILDTVIKSKHHGAESLSYFVLFLHPITNIMLIVVTTLGVQCIMHMWKCTRPVHLSTKHLSKLVYYLLTELLLNKCSISDTWQ